MESNDSVAGSSGTGIELRLLGPLEVSRAGVAARLPPSRKVRLLIA